MTKVFGTTIGSRKTFFTPCKLVSFSILSVFFNWKFLSLFSTTIAEQVLLVDEVMKAGLSSLKGN